MDVMTTFVHINFALPLKKYYPPFLAQVRKKAYFYCKHKKTSNK